MKALVIKADETQVLIDLEQEVQTLQNAVGGYIEAIVMTDDWIMYGNEEGNLMGLPFNPKASALVVSMCETLGVPVPQGADNLVGDVVVVGSDGGPENAPISDVWVQRFQEMGLWA